MANATDEVNALRAEHACAVSVPASVAREVDVLRGQGAVPVDRRRLPRSVVTERLEDRPHARVSAFVRLADESRELGAGAEIPVQTAGKANLRTVELSVEASAA